MDQTLSQVFYYVVYHLTRALTAVIQRDSYLYWPFLLSAIVIAVAVAALATTAGGPRGSRLHVLREYLSAHVWWHRSAKADYRLYIANAIALPVVFGVLMFGDTHVVNLIERALGRAPSVRPGDLASADIFARLAFTVLVFIAYDFGRFVAHCALHEIPVLWEFHKVHHSAETLNPMTTFRAHPIDLLVMAWVPVVTTGVVTWTFNQIVAVPVSVYTYLGMHIALFASNLIGTLRHSNVWLSYGPRWNKVFISPAQHQLHHSCEAMHIGCNRGFELAIWDRMFGTLYVPNKRETFRMGLGDGTDGEWHNVRRMYWWPFVNAGRKIFGTRPERLDKTAPPSDPRIAVSGAARVTLRGRRD
jgi:sterol desaturase/sphingolipid hydroxylase (fatty acid hydroxylase superfamily)